MNESEPNNKPPLLLRKPQMQTYEVILRGPGCPFGPICQVKSYNALAATLTVSSELASRMMDTTHVQEILVRRISGALVTV